MTLKITILGCGTSGGTPRIGNRWGACDPAEAKNRRLRCSLLVQREGEEGVTTVMVDTAPDLRQQLLDADVGWLDGVLYTHDHADHTHGIDDLRMVAFNGGARVEVYYDADTGKTLRARFGYCFETPRGSEYPASLSGHEITPGETVAVSGAGGPIDVLPFRQIHGPGASLGLRFGGLAY
jgi:phosphoribosyl 1,2-cyclic phosphate phosphodiesterase